MFLAAEGDFTRVWAGIRPAVGVGLALPSWRQGTPSCAGHGNPSRSSVVGVGLALPCWAQGDGNPSPTMLALVVQSMCLRGQPFHADSCQIRCGACCN